MNNCSLIPVKFVDTNSNTRHTGPATQLYTGNLHAYSFHVSILSNDNHNVVLLSDRYQDMMTMNDDDDDDPSQECTSGSS